MFIKKVGKLDVTHKEIDIKQHARVTYLGFVLDSAISGESITLKHLHSFLSKLRQNGSQFEYIKLATSTFRI